MKKFYIMIISSTMMNLLIIIAITAQLYSGGAPGAVKVVAPGRLEELLASDLFANCRVAGETFEVTAYCPGPCCNTGTVLRNGVTVTVDWSDRVSSCRLSLSTLRDAGIGVVAVDPLVVPYGALVRYHNRLYLALDQGSAIRGNRLDLFLPTHAETVQFGRRRNQAVIVYVPSGPSAVVRSVDAHLMRGVPFPND